MKRKEKTFSNRNKTTLSGSPHLRQTTVFGWQLWPNEPDLAPIMCETRQCSLALTSSITLKRLRPNNPNPNNVDNVDSNDSTKRSEMTFHKPTVLFLSTGNATRSLIAEGFLRNLTGDRFDVASAATEPSALNPLAGDVMKEAGIDISRQKPKSVAQSVKESFGYVIAICDTAKERSPIFPFTLHLLHWNIADPNSAGGLPEQKTEVFRRVRDEIKDKVRQFIEDTAKTKATELSIA